MAFSMDRASKYTNLPRTTAADTAIESGNSITVYGISICHTGRVNQGDSPAYCIFEEYGTTTEIMRVELEPGNSYESGVQWLAGAGLQVTLDAFYLDCTVWHSQAGS